MQRWKLENYAIIAVGQSAGHCERLRSILANQEVTVQSGADIDLSDLTKLRTTADVHIAQGGLQRGFILSAAGLVLLGTEDILPQRRRIATKTTAPRTEFTLNSFRDLQPGALVVHTDHGVGRYEGLVKLEAGDVAGDYLKLQYRGEDLLYVPVYKLDRVQRYAADTQSNAGLAKLGGVSWERVRKRAKKAAEETWQGAQKHKQSVMLEHESPMPLPMNTMTPSKVHFDGMKPATSCEPYKTFTPI